MSETLRDLVVSLSLDTDNFSRNIKTINNQIKEAESEFALAGAGMGNFEKTLGGAKAKAELLNKQIKYQQQILSQQQRSLAASNKKLDEQAARCTNLKEKLAGATQAEKENAEQVAKWDRQLKYALKTFGEESAEAQTAAEELERYKTAHAESAKEVKKLEGQITATENAMITSSNTITKTETNINQTKKTIAELNKELKNFDSNWDIYGQAFIGFGEKANKAADSMKRVGMKLMTNVTAPIMAAETAAAKAAINYEEAFAGVRKTVEYTGDDAEAFFDGLSDSVIEMSKRLATSAGDIAGVMEIAGQLGIENDALVEFTETIVRLGMSTNMQAEDAATIMARFANIMNMNQKEFGNMGAAVVDLGNKFATTESEILEMALNIAAAGKQVGLSEAQVLGFATALSSVGIQAEKGGSAFSKALKKMEIAVVTDSKALKDFADVAGMTQEEFKRIWNYDPAEAFQAFIVGLSRMDEEGISAIATLDEIGLSEVRLSDTLLRATNANELFAQAQQEANRAWLEGSALENESNIRLETMQSKLTNLKNELVALGIEFGELMMPIIEDIVKTISGMLKWFEGLDDGMKSFLIKFGLIAAGVGPVIMALGKLTGAVGTTANGIGLLFKAIAKVPEGMKKLGDTSSKIANLFSPGSAIVMGLTATIGLVAVLMAEMKKAEAVQPKFRIDTSDLENYKVKHIDVETTMGIDVGMDIKGQIKDVGTEIYNILNDGLPETDADRKKMSESVQNAISVAFTAIEDTYNQRRDELTQLYKYGLIDKDTYDTSMTDLENQATGMKDDLTEKAEAVTDYVNILCDNNRATTDEEIATLNALLEVLGLTTEKVLAANNAQMESMRLSYDKTRLGIGSDRDREQALQYIELMYDVEAKEIEAKRALLDRMVADKTTGKSDEEIEAIVAEYKDAYQELDDLQTDAEKQRKAMYGELNPLSDEDQEELIDNAEKLAEARKVLKENNMDGNTLGFDYAMMDPDGKIAEAMETVDELRDMFQEVPEEYKDYLKTLQANGVTEGFDFGNEDDMLKYLTGMSDVMEEETKKLPGKMKDTGKDTGENIVAGVALGVNDGTAGYTSAMTTMAEDGMGAFMKAMGIHSPSTVMHEQGGFIMEGLANGITDSASLPINAMREAASAVVAAAAAELDRLMAKANQYRAAAQYMFGSVSGGGTSGGGTNGGGSTTYNGGVTLTGNTFVINDKQDAQSLAIEIATQTKRQNQAMGLK